MDIDGYNCTIQAQEIRKILVHSHGNEAFERVRVVNDAITKGRYYKYPRGDFVSGQHHLSPKLAEGEIGFPKRSMERTTVVSYVSKRSTATAVQTIRAQKRKPCHPRPDAPMSGPLSLTPENDRRYGFNNSMGKNLILSINIPKKPEKDTGTRFYMDDAVEEVHEGIRGIPGDDDRGFG